jgi:energy-coupling factor transporter ATP-binding protein EcfA2
MANQLSKAPSSATHITDDGQIMPDYEYNDYGLAVFKRDVFCESYFHFKKGEHVVFGGPTQRGKTTLAFQLVRHIATPEYPAYIAVSKPDDSTSIEWGQRLGYRRISEFPPTRKVRELDIFDGKPSGYLVWPQFGDIDLDIPNAQRVHGKMLKQTYADGAKGKACILVMDDTMVKAKVMHLDGQMVTILAMAGAMGISLWIFVQKPTDSGRTTVWGYEQATHLFFTKGGDDKVLSRYAEIAGEKGPIVKAVVPKLEPYQFLYMHKYEGFICIVDAD